MTPTPHTDPAGPGPDPRAAAARHRRRRFLPLAAAVPAVLVLAACGQGAAESNTPPPAAATGAAAVSGAAGAGAPAAGGALRLVPLPPGQLGAPAVPAPAASTAPGAVPHDPAVAVYNAYGTDAAPGVFPRTVRHGTGTTELPRAPQRVLPLDSGELDSVVQLGVKPIGYLDHDPRLMPDYLVEALKGLPTVGTLAEPNLEAIAALAPDLMLTSKIRHEQLADRLKAIGPTVFGERTGVVWKQNFALHARAMGREAQADATVKEYEARVKALNAALPSPRPTVSVVRVTATNLRYYQRANYSGTILNDLGFPRPAAQNVDDFALLNQSLETLGPMGDADVIVVCPTEGEQMGLLREMRNSGLWQNLGAVKQGRVLMALDDVWMAGIGYRSAGVILEDIARFFKVQGARG
ncbi:MAG TPA: iron-siderophore ABC transporter substrate-binding protein [Chloroflexota bacterium]|nr:iron-siderophore ABC transporter substrate-binding protein [Chloroflexota bacterium]